MDAERIPVTIPELLRLMRDIVIAPRGETAPTGYARPHGDAATSTAPAEPISAGMLVERAP